MSITEAEMVVLKTIYKKGNWVSRPQIMMSLPRLFEMDLETLKLMLVKLCECKVLVEQDSRYALTDKVVNDIGFK